VLAYVLVLHLPALAPEEGAIVVQILRQNGTVGAITDVQALTTVCELSTAMQSFVATFIFSVAASVKWPRMISFSSSAPATYSEASESILEELGFFCIDQHTVLKEAYFLSSS